MVIIGLKNTINRWNRQASANNLFDQSKKAHLQVSPSQTKHQTFDAMHSEQLTLRGFCIAVALSDPPNE
jgi:hypothetical protein